MRELLTKTLTSDELLGELRFLVSHFNAEGFETCEVLFGYAWGIQYYPGDEWSEETITLTSLEDKVKSVEASGIGCLGNDDVFVGIADLRFQFCHDSDLHLLFEYPSRGIEYFYERWKSLNYEPAEWLKNQKNGPGEKLR